MLVYCAIIFIGLASGMLSGLAGFGGLIIMVPALTLLLGMSKAVSLGVFCGIATQAANAFAYREHVRTGPLVQMLLAGLPGLWLGSFLLLYLPEAWLRAALGLLLMAYALNSAFGRSAPPSRPPHAFWACFAGFCSGMLGGALGINGPPAVVYATRTGWGPDAIRALLAMFCGLLFVAAAITLTLRGLVGGEVLRLSLLALPACLAGNVVGRRMAKSMDAARYLRLVLSLLLLMGLSLCWGAARVIAGA